MCVLFTCKPLYCFIGFDPLSLRPTWDITGETLPVLCNNDQSDPDDILITGIAGRFPKSNSVKELQENLFNKIDLISGDQSRWKKTQIEIPQRTGKINDVEKFDASFFGTDFQEAHAMEPMVRLFLERVYECLIDAGVNPCELHNTNTGVFVGHCFSENERKWFYDKLQVNDHHGILGCSRATAASYISRWLKLTGPSYVLDTACSSALYALEHAYKSIKDGRCDAAIVGGVNLVLNPTTSLIFQRLGVLSDDGRCKSFDHRANGYVRSESIIACFLQKAKDSRRVHAKIVHAKTNCDGYKSEGITYPSGKVQQILLDSFYSECGIIPSSVEFVEAHGTGTFVGDPEELAAIDRMFCKGRKEPLKVGSVKSNLGHSEASSGLNSLTKAIIAYNTGYIPPNINFEKPRDDIPALVEGRLRVINEKEPWNRGLFALSSFGFGGANAHVLVENIAKEKINNGLPCDSIPRLVCVSGRTELAVARILDDLACRPVDAEEVRLWHAIHEKNIPGHHYRGFIILESTTTTKSIELSRDIHYYHTSEVQKQSSVWFQYTDLRRNWLAVAKQLSALPTFDRTLKRCLSALGHGSIDFIQPFNGGDMNSQQNFATVGAAAVCIALTDLLKSIGIIPDYILGNGIGEVCSAYVNGSLSAEHAIIAACKLRKVFPPAEEQAAKFASAKNTTIIQLGVHENKHIENYSELLRNNVFFVPLCTENADSIKFLLVSLGRLYNLGLNQLLANIYPEISFPVAQGTPMLSHLVEWDHTDNWIVNKFGIKEDSIPCGQRKVKVDVREEIYNYILGHAIDGRVIFPGTGYIVLVWETLALMQGRLFKEMPVEFKDVYLKRATYIPKDGYITFTITIDDSGKFEVTENDISVVSGYVFEIKNNKSIVTQCYNEKLPDLENVSEILSSKDFYKETNIRGYEYKGLFRGVHSCTVDCTRGRLAWQDNWVTFLDTLLQTSIVLKDSRLLYLPTWIKSISIDTKIHNDIIFNMTTSNNLIEFRSFPYIQMIRAGGVELRGVNVVSVSKKPPKGIPVYEKSCFIPNFSIDEMTVKNVLRTDLQLIYENIQTYKFKTVELIDEEYKANNLNPITELVAEILADLPLVQADLFIISKEKIEMPPNVTVIDKKFSGESNNILFVGANLLQRHDILMVALGTLKQGCFILSRENTIPDAPYQSSQYDIITAHNIGHEYIVLIREKKQPEPTNYINVVSQDTTFSWINAVKINLKEGRKLVLYSQNEPMNGLLGLVNCLRKEPGGENVSGVLIADPTAPPFNPECKFYQEQLDKDLGVNVFKNGQWGTYRHLLLEELETVPTAHAYVNVETIGDLSSLKWWEGRHSEKPDNPSRNLVQVYCSALNFRDVMTALGRVTLDAVAVGRLAQDCVQGVEFAGRTANGTRVMGVGNYALSNLVEGNEGFVWPLLEEWTFEEAVTIPVAYGTVYLALVMIGNIRRGESILIHAGSGGVGQAAIRVALHHGLEVYTTVGTAAKRTFVKRLFPQLKDSHIGNSRDTSFENMIRRETQGKGVDVVLNSLSDDKLQASAKCLRRYGRFLEIGKYDITMNTQIQMCFLKNDISFHGVMFDYITGNNCGDLIDTLGHLMMTGIQTGAVRPLTYCTFQTDEIETAYRYMAAGKHIGKIVLKIREEESLNTLIKATPKLINAVPRYTCDENHVYVLVGGLGGFGLELADWLIIRGARKLVLSSRRGISNGYQALRIRIWKSYGARIEIAKQDVTLESGCKDMLKIAAAMGPVKAIFNLAVILNDAVFQNQTPETFLNSCRPKAMTTINLDKLSRTLCPNLRDFVIFSSVSCGRGNAGQTNYGFSNSIMERICEERKKYGLPALAIQWGAIGDVGLVADMQEENVQLEIGGTLQQRISSCLQALDKFLKQDATIVSSIVVAEKRASNSNDKGVVEVIAHVLGIKDLKSVSRQAALSEMGMDSVMAVEIKQTLERDYEIFLTAQEIRMLTFSRLTELTATASSDQSVPEGDSAGGADESSANGPNYLTKNFGDEKMASLPFIYLKSNVFASVDSDDVLFLLPGLESCGSTFKSLCRQLNAKTCALQLGLDTNETEIEQAIDKLVATIKFQLKPGAPFKLLGYSFGSLLVLKVAARLESEGYKGLVFCLDGSPVYSQKLLQNTLPANNDADLQNQIICHCISSLNPTGSAFNDLTKKLANYSNFDDKIKCAIEMFPEKLNYSDQFLFSITKVTYNRIKMLLNTGKINEIDSPIVLIRPRKLPLRVECNDSYDLDKLTRSNVAVHYVEANHSNIVSKNECAVIINDALANFNVVNNKAVRTTGTR